jgi:hypothetical protein
MAIDWKTEKYKIGEQMLSLTEIAVLVGAVVFFIVATLVICWITGSWNTLKDPASVGMGANKT